MDTSDWFWLTIIIVVLCVAAVAIFEDYFEYKSRKYHKNDNKSDIDIE